MLKVEGVIKQDRLLRALTGLNQKDFDDHLMLTAAGLWNFYLKAA